MDGTCFNLPSIRQRRSILIALSSLFPFVCCPAGFLAVMVLLFSRYFTIERENLSVIIIYRKMQFFALQLQNAHSSDIDLLVVLYFIALR